MRFQILRSARLCTWLIGSQSSRRRRAVFLGVEMKVVSGGQGLGVLFEGRSSGQVYLRVATGSHLVRPPGSDSDLSGVYPCWILGNARVIAQRVDFSARVMTPAAGSMLRRRTIAYSMYWPRTKSADCSTTAVSVLRLILSGASRLAWFRSAARFAQAFGVTRSEASVLFGRRRWFGRSGFSA